jgi:predicted benzoate:H+ symporter BenE
VSAQGFGLFSILLCFPHRHALLIALFLLTPVGMASYQSAIGATRRSSAMIALVLTLSTVFVPDR